ncbi:MAG: IS4 family transposase [Mucilaginibacter sp.]|uniref:IS4 family transposase n=1 Tax=Mucilaginibacter sp. TaxID=1882438 RepID=UPI003263E744
MNYSFEPDKLASLARQSGFLQRGSKLKPEDFITTLMFSDLDHSRLSLQDCCNELEQQSGKSLSKVALHKRFNQRSLEFLKLVLSEQMSLKLDLSGENDWPPFSRVLISDSTKFALPKQCKNDYPGFGGMRSQALMNIQYAFDIKSGNWETLELVKATQSDNGYSKSTYQHILKGDLLIRDLGYMTHEYLATVAAEEAFFLNRLHPQWKPVQAITGKFIDWVGLYKKMQGSFDKKLETIVTVGKGEQAFDCRLIAVPVPEQVWAERIRKAKIRAKSQRHTLSDEYKARARFSVFITNTDENTLKATDVIQLYRLRWQVELIFKTWKSLLDVHKVKSVKKERLECQLIAKFIWILLNWKAFRCIDSFIKKGSLTYACSMWKFFKQAKLHSQSLKGVVTGKLTCRHWLKLCILPIIRNMLIEPKKDKEPSFAIVNGIFNPLS